MKHIYLFLFFLTFLNQANCQVFFKGIISGKTNASITLFRPINTFFNLNNELSSQKIKILNDSTFECKIDSGFISGIYTLKLSDKVLYLLVEKGDSIYLKIDLNTTKNWVEVTGNNKPGHMLFNKYLSQPILNFSDIYDYFDKNKMKTSEPTTFFRKNILNKTFFLDSLLNKKLITSFFYLTAKTSISVSQANEFLKPFLRPSTIQNLYSQKKIDYYIDSIFSIVNPLNELVLKSFAGRNYVTSYYQNMEKKIKGYPNIFKIKDTIITHSNEQKLRVSDSYTAYFHIKDKLVMEYLWGTMLYDIQNIFPETITETDIIAFEIFFPKSIFLQRLKSQAFKIFINGISRLNPEIVIDSTNDLKSLPQIHNKYFSGEYVYVDLWATWCIPCKNEFENNSLTDSLFDLRKIKRMYISLDDKKVFKTWLNNVYSFNLKGLNIIANTSLKNSILKSIYNSPSYSIPRYILLGRDGKIINVDAPRPSDPNLILLLNKLAGEK